MTSAGRTAPNNPMAQTISSSLRCACDQRATARAPTALSTLYSGTRKKASPGARLEYQWPWKAARSWVVSM